MTRVRGNHQFKSRVASRSSSLCSSTSGVVTGFNAGAPTTTPDTCGRERDFASRSRPLFPHGTEGTTARNCEFVLRVGVFSCRYKNRFPVPNPQLSGAPRCTAVQSIALVFTSSSLARNGRRKQPRTGPSPQASSRAWSNTGCPVATFHPPESSRFSDCSIDKRRAA